MKETFKIIQSTSVGKIKEYLDSLRNNLLPNRE